MKSQQMSTFSKEALQEYGALLLLDHLMRYELLQVEKIELCEIIEIHASAFCFAPTINITKNPKDIFHDVKIPLFLGQY